MEFIQDLSPLEQAEWNGYVERATRNGVVRHEAERVAREAVAAGVRLLPAPDSVTAPGGTLIELTAVALRVSTAIPRVGEWFASRHERAWANGWKPDEWSAWIGEEECLAKCPQKVHHHIGTLDAAAERKATLTAERVAITRKALQAAG